jgi:hypothetical protein
MSVDRGRGDAASGAQRNHSPAFAELGVHAAASFRATAVAPHPMEEPMLNLSANAALIRLRDEWRRMVCKRRSLVELAACPPSELQRIAQDVGVSVSDLRAVAATQPGPSELLPMRLELLGLDPGYVRAELTATYRDMERMCAMCPAWRHCRRDLAEGDAQAGMESYCLCSPTIDALAFDEAGLPPAMTCEPWLPRRRSMSWPMYHRVERRAGRMQEMMARLHVDPGKLARLRRGDAYAEARARCLSCRMSQECLHWLADSAEAEKRPEFCPNLTLFATCQRDRAAP